MLVLASATTVAEASYLEDHGADAVVARAPRPAATAAASWSRATTGPRSRPAPRRSPAAEPAPQLSAEVEHPGRGPLPGKTPAREPRAKPAKAGPSPHRAGQNRPHSGYGAPHGDPPGPPRGDRMEPRPEAHGADGHPAHRDRPARGRRAARLAGRAQLRPGALEPAEPRSRDLPSRGAGRPGRADRRPARVGLRRVRGDHHGRDPRAAAGLVPVARRLPGRGDGGRRGAARGPGDRVADGSSRATPRCSPTATCCAC